MSFLLSAWLIDVAHFLLRLMVGIVFISSGYAHLKNPNARSKSIGISKAFTMFLGAAELAGGLGVASGVFVQLAALGLILMVLGATGNKIFIWHTGFWGKDGTNGWSYDTMLIVMNRVIGGTGDEKHQPYSNIQVRPALSS
jgi:putative oxidoreductase